MEIVDKKQRNYIKNKIMIYLLFFLLNVSVPLFSQDNSPTIAESFSHNSAIIISMSIIFGIILLILFFIMRFLVNCNIKELRESREQYRTIAEDMPVLICQYSLDFTVTYINKTYGVFYSVNTDELIGKPLFSTILEEDRAEVISNISSLSMESPSCTQINRTILPNGEVKWQQWLNRALFDKAGNITGYQSLGQDITEKKHSEELLIESEKRFRNAISRAPVPIMIQADDGEVLNISSTWAELTGYTLDEISTREKWFKKAYGGYSQELSKKIDSLFDLDEPFNEGEFIISCADGSKRIWEFRSIYIGILQDKRRVLMSVANDLTEKKHSESERELLFSAIDQISDMVVLLNYERNIIYVNSAFERITGYSREEAIGQSSGLLKSGVQDDEFYNNVWKTINTGKSWTGRFINRKKDGSFYTEQTAISPLFDADGKVLNYIEIKRDITKEIQLQEQLHHKSKMDVVGQLAGGIAHDFNNALSGIMSAAELLKSPKRELDETGLKYIDMIQEASHRASDLSSRLLTFSRKNNLTLLPVDLHNLIRETREILLSTIDKKVKINIELNAGNSIVSGSESELHNILLNLCINATHSMPTGGILTIKTGGKELDSEYCSLSEFSLTPATYCWFEVSDTGVGIENDNLKKIFEPFYTTKEQGEGTGLGLAAVYGTVQSHKGAIEVKSQLNKGSTFRVYLPVSELDIPDENRSHIFTGKGLILFVDDEEINRIVGKDMIESLGYEVLLAANGIEAVETYKKHADEIDLIILDMIMPEMNGKETFIKMRELNSHCRVILSSGYSNTIDIIKMRELGLTAELHKPYRIEELSRLLKNILNQ